MFNSTDGPSVLCEQGVMQGTIPYLGTFLTDLVMMDTAMKDYTEVRHLTCVFTLIAFVFCRHFLMFLYFLLQGGLINFEKRRKVNSMFFFCNNLKKS